jgi:hypothetical protein
LAFLPALFNIFPSMRNRKHPRPRDWNRSRPPV